MDWHPRPLVPVPADQVSELPHEPRDYVSPLLDCRTPFWTVVFIIGNWDPCFLDVWLYVQIFVRIRSLIGNLKSWVAPEHNMDRDLKERERIVDLPVKGRVLVDGRPIVPI